MSGSSRTFAQEALDGKRRVLMRQLAVEHARRAGVAPGGACGTRDARREPDRDSTRTGELAVQLPVYRMYPVQDEEPADADRRVLAQAYERAVAAVDPADRFALDHVATWLGLPVVRVPRADAAALHAARVAFAQLTAPLAAKGVEDTAHYRYGRLLSRNEVGADAGDFSLSRGAFHARNRHRARTVPHGIVATATHDHKRGEDARARLAVLSEMPDAWRAVSLDWSALNRPHRGSAHRDLAWAPGPAAEAMLYQTLVGCWPPELAPDDAAGRAALTERVVQWQTALREAKRHTDWLAPDIRYERDCEAFVRAILKPRGAGDFAHRLHAFVARIAPAGVVNSLTQAVLRMASPGVPDLYQGSESWDHSLVDPDNRRDVPFAALAAERVDGPVASYLAAWPDARVKRALVERMLALRARWPATFADGAYVPLRVRGPLGRHAVAFARCSDEATVVVVATRLAGRLLGEAPELPRVGPRNGAIRRSCCRAISTGRGWTGWRRGMRSTWRDAFCRSTAAWRPCLSRCSSPRIRPSRVGDVGSRASLRCTHCTTDNPSAVNAGRRSPDASSCCITIRCCSTSAKTSSRSIWSCSGARCTRSSVANSCAVSMLVPRWRLREMRAGEQQCMQGPCRVAWRRRYPGRLRAARCGTHGGPCAVQSFQRRVMREANRHTTHREHQRGQDRRDRNRPARARPAGARK